MTRKCDFRSKWIILIIVRQLAFNVPLTPPLISTQCLENSNKAWLLHPDYFPHSFLIPYFISHWTTWLFGELRCYPVIENQRYITEEKWIPMTHMISEKLKFYHKANWNTSLWKIWKEGKVNKSNLILAKSE